MYEQLQSFLYKLKINGETIKENDPRRRTIQQFQTNIRRSGLMSLNIVFNDNDLYWRNLFTSPKPVKVEFEATNLDGSVPESFEGYVSEVSPSMSRNLYDIEVMCLNASPRMTNTQSKTRVFKKMSRKQVILKLASELKAKAHIYTTTELNVVEDEITLGVNTSYVDFMVQILEEVGYRFTILNFTEWIISPIFSTSAKHLGEAYTNLHGDTTLLDFEPKFSRYSYEEDETKGTGKDGEKTKKAVDPNTKKTEDVKDKNKPNTNPESKTGGSEMYYDPKSGQWKKVK